MRAYYSYFKSELMVGLQYRAAALAGLSTQFFWGIILSFIYTSFYQHASISNFSINELMCYVWLNQAFFSLIYPSVKDGQIMDQIKNGTVAYELCRPYDLYWWWYLKILSKRYASCMLRCLPVLIFAFILPAGYKLILPNSVLSFILFIITLFLGTIVITGINMIIQSISFFTNEDKGISSIFYAFMALLSGITIPLPLLPDIINGINYILPFRLISDLPYRTYSGNMGINSVLISILMQVIWIIILIIIGKIIMKKILTKVSIQGG